MDERRLPLTEHLAELRRRLVRALLAWAVGTVAAWAFREEIFRELLRPAVEALAAQGGQLQAIAPGEIFFTYLKGAALAGFVVALPVVLWQAWAFVAPGLYPSEKRYAVPFVAISTLLFVSGALFGHQFVFPLMFAFLGSFESEFVQAAWTMREVWSLTTSMFLAFGVAFELPVVVFFLAAAGVVDVRQLLRGFPYAVLACFVVGAVLTPSPDWVSQTMLAVPMCVLYLLGVLAAWLFGGKRARGAAAEQSAASEVARV
jgi:sec-independent protein translocase protein TatC